MLRALTDYLREQGRIATPCLFLRSAEAALADTTAGAAAVSAAQRAIRTIRQALDRGLPARPRRLSGLLSGSRGQ